MHCLSIYLSKKSRLGRHKCRNTTRAPNNVKNSNYFAESYSEALFERIRGAFCDDALYKLTFTFTFIVYQVDSC